MVDEEQIDLVDYIDGVKKGPMLGTGSGTVQSTLAIRKDDFYATPPVAIKALMRAEKLPKRLWECACGDGALVRVLRDAGHTVIATDLVDRGCPDATPGVDFLMETKQSAPKRIGAVITNPPFKNAEQFVLKALEFSPRVYMLLRLAFLEGLRWERGLSENFSKCLVFAPRLPFMHRDDFAEAERITGSAIPFAWFVWDKAHVGGATIGWLDPRKDT